MFIGKPTDKGTIVLELIPQPGWLDNFIALLLWIFWAAVRWGFIWLWALLWYLIGATTA